MITLRAFNDGDIAIFEKWLHEPHVRNWFSDPEDWLAEAEGREGDFFWIRHYIAEHDGAPVGFCQYYDYARGGESWYHGDDVNGCHSIDYLIGNEAFLRKGLGKEMVLALIELIRAETDAARIIVQPDEKNTASRELLRSCGFAFDKAAACFVLAL